MKLTVVPVPGPPFLSAVRKKFNPELQQGNVLFDPHFTVVWDRVMSWT